MVSPRTNRTPRLFLCSHSHKTKTSHLIIKRAFRASFIFSQGPTEFFLTFKSLSFDLASERGHHLFFLFSTMDWSDSARATSSPRPAPSPRSGLGVPSCTSPTERQHLPSCSTRSRLPPVRKSGPLRAGICVHCVLRSLYRPRSVRCSISAQHTGDRRRCLRVHHSGSPPTAHSPGSGNPAVGARHLDLPWRERACGPTPPLSCH